MTPQDPDEIVRLATARNPFEAHAWEQALREEGIPVKVVGDYLDAGIGDISGFLPELWVRRDDLARAEKLLGALEKKEEPPSEEAEGD
ncbi:MAG TPA: DUF2007 domain-containing protein [Gemmataceae bacterium]|nr:DUF2007 domain-containing protein [Gemmataceae bacterium]